MKIQTEINRSPTEKQTQNPFLKKKPILKRAGNIETEKSLSENRSVSKIEIKMRRLDKELKELQTKYTQTQMYQLDSHLLTDSSNRRIQKEAGKKIRQDKLLLVSKINHRQNEMENLTASLSVQKKSIPDIKMHLDHLSKQVLQKINGKYVNHLIRS